MGLLSGLHSERQLFRFECLCERTGVADLFAAKDDLNTTDAHLLEGEAWPTVNLRQPRQIPGCPVVSPRTTLGQWCAAVIHSHSACSAPSAAAMREMRYVAGRAFRQYYAADPANRLVAGEFEARWTGTRACFGNRRARLPPVTPLCPPTSPTGVARHLVLATTVSVDDRCVPRPDYVDFLKGPATQCLPRARVRAASRVLSSSM